MVTAVPKAAPTALPELDTYLAPFTALFRRRWSRERLERSITGLLTDLPHKTCDTIAGAVAGILCTGKCFTFLSPGFLVRNASNREGRSAECQSLSRVEYTSTERLQHLLTDADWDASALDQHRVTQLVAISPAGGLLALDDTTFPKQGRASVGVGRQ